MGTMYFLGEVHSVGKNVETIWEQSSFSTKNTYESDILKYIK